MEIEHHVAALYSSLLRPLFLDKLVSLPFYYALSP